MPTDKRPSADFDWDRAIAGLQRIFADLDRKDRARKARERRERQART